jgi:hypothetical protein
VTPESKGVFYPIWKSSYEVYIILWAKLNFSYALETVFSVEVIITLTFDHVTPKSIGYFSQYGQSSHEV